MGLGTWPPPHRGSLSPAGFLVDPGEDLLLSGVPTEPTGGRGGTAGPCHRSCQLWAERRVGSWAGGGVRAAVAPPGAPPDLRCPRLQTQLIQMVVWMLQRRLLVQLHTYVCLMASPSEDEPRAREDDAPLATRVGGRSLSTPNALSFGSPSRASCPWASVWGAVSTWAPLGEAGGWEVRLGHLQVSRAPSQGCTRAPAHTRPTGQLCLGDGRSFPASLRTGLCLAESEQPGSVWGWSRPHRIPGGPLKPAAAGPLWRW